MPIIEVENVPVKVEELDDLMGNERQPMDLNELYEHAPRKVDGDPWAILLKPELEADKMRCDAWKEEVQTLLIFAGLFSAVVTAFVVESYKFLQPDPSDAIVDLLFHIAHGLNNTTPFPPSTKQASSFSQSSSTRINIFWFLSLILSLTTVLVGTIGLQWLREHQAYPEYSAKETLAILRMRTQAIEAWHVAHIFTALPLLLQGALVLFFAGLIDFSIPLGMKVTIPVAIIIGLTLLFLGATTVYPTLQALFFLTGMYPRKKIPSPCAFKSPQAHAFRTLSLTGFHLLANLALRLPKFTFSKYLFRNRLPPTQSHLYPYMYTIWTKKDWPNIDREWLPLRDACHQRILDDDPDLHRHQRFWGKAFPLSDITQCVVEAVKQAPSAKHSEVFLRAAYHCFQEISASVWTNHWSFPERIDRRNHYFEQLQGDWSISSTARFFLHGGMYRFKVFSNNTAHLDNYIGQHSSLFRQEQAFLFLHTLLEKHKSPALNCYRIELWPRLMQHVLRSRMRPLTSSTYNLSVLTLFDIYPFDPSRLADSVMCSVDLLTTIFDSAAISPHIPDDQLSDHLCTHRQIPHLLHNLAVGIAVLYQRLTAASNIIEKDNLQDTFKFVADYLDNEMLSAAESSSDSSLQEKTPTLLFYLSSIFTQKLLEFSEVREVIKDRDNSFSGGFRLFIKTLQRYKSWTFGRKSVPIETQFNDADYFEWKGDLIARFSDKWWDALFNGPNGAGLCATDQAAMDIPSLTYAPENTDIAKLHELIQIERYIPLSHQKSSPVGNSDRLT